MSPPHSIVVATARPWAGAKVGKCYNNAQEMIHRYGGQLCYGWALTDYGPHRCNGHREPPPLYRRWLNHVVWRDHSGKLWEVSPNVVIDGQFEVAFKDSEFLPDGEATFEIKTEHEWFTRPTQYVAVRPEGEAIVELLTKAQHSVGGECHFWAQRALAALEQFGFRPREWKVEIVGDRTGSIWLLAE